MACDCGDALSFAAYNCPANADLYSATNFVAAKSGLWARITLKSFGFNFDRVRSCHMRLMQVKLCELLFGYSNLSWLAGGDA